MTRCVGQNTLENVATETKKVTEWVNVFPSIYNKISVRGAVNVVKESSFFVFKRYQDTAYMSKRSGDVRTGPSFEFLFNTVRAF